MVAAVAKYVAFTSWVSVPAHSQDGSGHVLALQTAFCRSTGWEDAVAEPMPADWPTTAIAHGHWRRFGLVNLSTKGDPALTEA